MPASVIGGCAIAPVFAAAGQRAEVGHRPVEANHPGQALDEARRLPERPAERHLHRKARLDGNIAVGLRAAKPVCRRGISPHRGIRPDGQRATALERFIAGWPVPCFIGQGYRSARIATTLHPQNDSPAALRKRAFVPCKLARPVIGPGLARLGGAFGDPVQQISHVVRGDPGHEVVVPFRPVRLVSIDRWFKAFVLTGLSSCTLAYRSARSLKRGVSRLASFAPGGAPPAPMPRRRPFARSQVAARDHSGRRPSTIRCCRLTWR